MGQAWCKEKTSKAQDSKSPLDRVFVHCAHRIYPGLKEEGSVLGGATQRVTSSEIGYAGSPPREVLTRGRSIDSVDRPFHPSDWVDVNLEVPSTPRASSVLTNLTVDTSLYPATTPTSSCSNLKDVTPVPPPRRRKRNKGRPLPPKPDEIPENSSSNFKHADTNEEPLYSSVKPPKSNEEEQQDTENEVEGKDKPSSFPEDSRHEIKRTKEVYEHKVNGTGRIISSDVVSGRRTSTEEERKTCKTSETSQEQKRSHEDDEYDRFVRNQLVKDSSTPNRQERRINPKEPVSQQIKEPSGDAEKIARTKNYSTVSLPNYDELDLSRHIVKRTKDENGDEEKTKSRRPVRSSTVSLPAESLLSPFSEKTSVRFEDYVSRRHIHENLSPYQVLEKLECPENGVVNGGFMKYDSRKSEEWNLHEDDDCELHLERRISFETTPVSEIDEEKRFHEDEDVVDFSPYAEIENHEKRLSIECKTSDDNTRLSPISLAKPEAFGKTPSTIRDEKDSFPVDGNRSPLQYFDPPTLAGACKASAACDSITTPVSREPFFLDEAKQRSALDTIGGSCRNSCNAVEADRSGQSRTIFGRSLSNESEPYEETYESKELRGHRGVTSELIRTISEESLPREMLEEHTATDDFFDEKRAKDVSNKMKKDLVDQKAKTPPPSPEPRIRAEILDNDHSSLLKVLKEEAAEESNLSSMTPSLTELEAALSDMLEKEEQHEDPAKELIKTTDSERCTSGCIEKLIEPEIVPVEKTSCSFNDDATIEATASEMVTHGTTKDQFLGDDLKEKTDGTSLSLGQILEERKSPGKVRKVSFCTWEELNMAEIDLKDDQEFADRDTTVDFNKDDRERRNSTDLEGIPLITKDSRDDRLGFDVSPEKPSRLLRNLEDPEELFAENVPTPPRRRNKGSLGVGRREIEIAQNGSAIGDPYPNDRLI